MSYFSFQRWHLIIVPHAYKYPDCLWGFVTHTSKPAPVNQFQATYSVSFAFLFTCGSQKRVCKITKDDENQFFIIFLSWNFWNTVFSSEREKSWKSRLLTLLIHFGKLESNCTGLIETWFLKIFKNINKAQVSYVLSKIEVNEAVPLISKLSNMVF